VFVTGVPDVENGQKISLKSGANAGSGLQCWRNLVEKVTAKKKGLIYIIGLFET
jgi:hypothetical protein